MKEVFENIKRESKDVSTLTDFVITVLSILLGLLIISGPLVFLINCLIYVDFRKMIAYGIALLVCIFITCSCAFYFYGITKGKVKGIYKLLICIFIISVIISEVVLIILFVFGVI